MTEEVIVRKKRPDLVILVAIYRFLVAGLCFLGGGAAAIGLIALVASATHMPTEDAWIGAFVLAFLLVFLGAYLVANVVAGWGLLAMKNWARWLTIVLSVLSLINFPIGTVAGALSIYYLLTEEARKAFEASA